MALPSTTTQSRCHFTMFANSDGGEEEKSIHVHSDAVADCSWDEGIVDGESDSGNRSETPQHTSAVAPADGTRSSSLVTGCPASSASFYSYSVGRDQFSYSLLAGLVVAISTYQVLRLGYSFWLLLPCSALLAAPLFLAYFFYFSHIHSVPGAGDVTRYARLTDRHLAHIYTGQRMPLLTFLDAYITERVELRSSHSLRAVLRAHPDWATLNVPLSFTAALFEHWMARLPYGGKILQASPITLPFDPANIKFRARFLGPEQRFACGRLTGDIAASTLPEMQHEALCVIGQHARLGRGHRHLDIGCGNGQLVQYAAQVCGTHSTGITVHLEHVMQAQRQCPPDTNAQFLCVDYRDLADAVYDRITCVGLKELASVHQFPELLRHLHRLLSSEGVALLQLDCVRQHWQLEDIGWNLFVDNYVFPGSDTMAPLAWYIQKLEQAGFEVESVEDLAEHAAATYQHWFNNWDQHCRATSTEPADASLPWLTRTRSRAWSVYLAGTALALERGTVGCYEVVIRKRHRRLHRRRWSLDTNARNNGSRSVVH